MILHALVILALLLAPLSPALASTQDVVVRTLNAQRAAHGLHAVAPHRQLMAAAEAQARDMARGGFMSHRGSDGSNLAQRVKRQRAAATRARMGISRWAAWQQPV